MDKPQAKAMLELIADLYRLANAPEPEPAPIIPNGRAATEPEPAR